MEAFNEGAQKWIAVDPLVTKSLAKPHNLEPPASDHLNIMSYVVAFNEDTTARDVTRRYTRAFNAKTRKIRVESTKGGEKWWEKTMEIYENPFVFDRDAMEFNELTSNTASEPMPRNVQDFKDHPFYALERHLRRNETIFPKRVIGHLAVGKSGSQNQGQKPVYRRSDVHVVRSADGWYRLGRDVKPGEQALKHVPANRNKLSGDIRDEEDDLTMETPLYAEYQTDVYRAPPIVNGKVPKNVYGNLDIYTPTMVPPGGIHIKRPDAAQAAKILAIDYAPAVTGFDFKGRHGTAVIHGIVVASEHRAAVELVISGLANERREAELEERSEQALRLWEQFMLKLRIAERVKGYAVEGDEPSAGVDESYEEPHDNAGGFLPESDYEGNDPFSTHNALSGNNSMRGSFFDTARQDPFAGGFIPDEGTGAALLGPISSGQDHAPSSTSGHAGHTSQYRLVVALENKSSDDSGVPEAFHLCSGPGNSVGLHSELGSAIPGAETSKEPEIPLEGDFERKSPSPDPSHTAPQEDTQMNSPNPSPKASDSDYQGSMLSEDPEDVDSFPEWLL